MSRDQGGNSVGAMEFEQITYRVDEGVATVTLNRPERLNAFTHRMCRELIMACDLAEADHEVRVVVLTGSGRAFCAGADLDPDAGQFDVTDMGAGELIDGAPPDASGIAALRFAAMRKPTIAAINGDAIGVGITMTLPMNIRIASTRARVGFVFTRRALVPEAASSWFLPRIVGIARAVEWVTTARIVLAEEACASGLISHLHPDDACSQSPSPETAFEPTPRSRHKCGAQQEEQRTYCPADGGKPHIRGPIHCPEPIEGCARPH